MTLKLITYCIIFAFIFLVDQLKAQPTFERIFLSSANPPDADECFKTLSLKNGNLVSVGLNDGFSFSQSNYYLRMSDSLGNEIWTKLFVPGTEGRDADICISGDSNIVIVIGNETTDSLNQIIYQSTFIKTNLNGDTLLTKTYPFKFMNASFYLMLYSVQDSDIILTTTEHIIRLNSSLDTIFVHSHSVGGISFINEQKSDIGIISHNAVIDSMVFVRYNISSDSFYEYSFDSSAYAALVSHGWLITGAGFGTANSIFVNLINYLSFGQASFVKLDSNLSLEWTKYLTAPHLLNGGMLVDSEKVLFTGRISYDNINNLGFIYELDYAGDSLKFKSFAPGGGAYLADFYPYSIMKNRGGYLVSGYVNSDTSVQKSYIASTDTSFSFPDFLDEPGSPSHDILVFPNPASEKLIVYSASGQPIRQLILYSMMCEIMQEVVSDGSNRHEWNVNGLSPGIYYLCVQTDKTIILKPIVITRN